MIKTKKASNTYYLPSYIESPYEPERSNNESVVSACSTGVASNGIPCFTNSACYPETTVSKATGQLQWADLSGTDYLGNVSGERWGTAFFISPDTILTAGHCFDKSSKKGGWYTPYANGRYLEPTELAPLLRIKMNYSHQTCAASSSDNPEMHEVTLEITELLEHRVGGLDYAIARVKGSPGSNYGIVSFDFNFTGGEIFVVQHPAGAPKKQESGFARTSSSNPSLLRHNANTLGGSSGSAVATMSDQVCAVHVSGTATHNSAVHINAIKDRSRIIHGFFRLQNPIIPRELSIKPTQSIEPAKPKKNDDSLSTGTKILIGAGFFAVLGGLALYACSQSEGEPQISGSKRPGAGPRRGA